MKSAIQKKSQIKKKGKSSSSLKVVYISSPMKVKTTASRFRALVQQLTGRDSDISKSMDIVENCNNFNDFNDNNKIIPSTTKLDKSSSVQNEDDHLYPFSQYFSSPVEDQTLHDYYSPTSSGSLIEQQEIFGCSEPFVGCEVEDLCFQDVFFPSTLLESYDAF